MKPNNPSDYNICLLRNNSSGSIPLESLFDDNAQHVQLTSNFLNIKISHLWIAHGNLVFSDGRSLTPPTRVITHKIKQKKELIRHSYTEQLALQIKKGFVVGAYRLNEQECLPKVLDAIGFSSNLRKDYNKLNGLIYRRETSSENYTRKQNILLYQLPVSLRLVR